MRTLNAGGSRRITALILLALALYGPGFAAERTSPSSVTMEAIPAAAVEAGAFATWGYRIRNVSVAPLAVTIRLVPPPGWIPVSTEQYIELAPGEAATIPFSIWVAPQASADLPHEILAEASSPTGTPLAAARRNVWVLHKHEVTLEPLSPLVSGLAGKKVHHTFRVKNTGNLTDTYQITVSSVPQWDTAIPVHRLTLFPGESTDLTVVVRIPRAAAHATRHVVTLNAELVETEPLAEVTLASAAANAEVLVRAPSTRRSLYRRLPARVAFSASGRGEEAAVYGVTLTTEGAVSEQTTARVDLDLVSQDKNADREGWSDRYALLQMRSEHWNACVGDVQGGVPGITTGTLSGRGARINYRGDRWAARAFAGKGRRSDDPASWAAGVEGRIAPWLWIGAELVEKKLDATSFVPWERLDLGCLTTRYVPRPGVDIALAGAWSRSELDGMTSRGAAAQLTADYTSDRTAIETRIFMGGREYRGRTGDGDGIVAYARYSPRSQLTLWTSVDASKGRPSITNDSRWLLTGACQVGAQLSPTDWPRVEVSAGGGLDHEWEDADLRKLDERDLRLLVWRTIGPLSFAASGRLGRAYNRLAGSDGRTVSYGFSVAGRALGITGTTRWNRDREWLPEAQYEREVSAVDGDLSWVSIGGSLGLGMGFSYRLHDTPLPGQSTQWDGQLRPRLNLRLRQGLSIRLDGLLVGADSPFETEYWQVQMSWAGAEVVPVLWSPVRGGIAGTVFVDGNQNGRLDRRERGVGGVIVFIDGEQHVSRTNGRFGVSGISPGSYGLDLNWDSLPAGLVPSELLPSGVRVETGKEVSILIPLVQSCELSGRVFLDADRDGTLGLEEAGVRDVRVVLLRDEVRVADRLTDHQGGYHFHRVHPGEYVIEPAEGWFPAGFEPTAVSRIEISLAAGDRVELPPYGIAPKRRPIIKTFGDGRVFD